MKSTVLQPLPAQPFRHTDDLLRWMNYQGLEFMRQVQQAMNFEYHGRATIQTAGTGVVTTAWTSPDMPTGSALAVDARVTARAADASGVDGRVDISGLFSRQGSGSVQTGATTTLVNIGPHLVTFAVSGNGVLVQVQDNAVHVVNWAVDIRMRGVQ